MRSTGLGGMGAPKSWEIKHVEKRLMVCEVCGCFVRRQRTFKQKVVRTFGVKTLSARQVLTEVTKRAAEWRPEPDCGRHRAPEEVEGS